MYTFLPIPNGKFCQGPRFWLPHDQQQPPWERAVTIVAYKMMQHVRRDFKAKLQRLNLWFI